MRRVIGIFFKKQLGTGSIVGKLHEVHSFGNFNKVHLKRHILEFGSEILEELLSTSSKHL